MVSLSASEVNELANKMYTLEGAPFVKYAEVELSTGVKVNVQDGQVSVLGE